MDHRNHWYGHSAILARYCGLPDGSPLRIAGDLQHGWTFVHGFGTGHRPLDGFGKFVWSDVVRRRGRSRGWRDFYTIGAPWNYLLEMVEDSCEEPRSGTIWYPFHGWDTNDLVGDHYRLIREIKEVETGPVTVCLYWLEYGKAAIRRIYESAGFRVITHGHRDNPDFLLGQLDELRRHKRVASNRLTTAIFYGVSAGCEPSIYGDPMMMAGTSPFYEGVERVPRIFPEMHRVEIDPRLAHDVTVEELGVRHLTPPEELRALFRWTALKGTA